jgi:hypothetical protein
MLSHRRDYIAKRKNELLKEKKSLLKTTTMAAGKDSLLKTTTVVVGSVQVPFLPNTIFTILHDF